MSSLPPVFDSSLPPMSNVNNQSSPMMGFSIPGQKDMPQFSMPVNVIHTGGTQPAAAAAPNQPSTGDSPTMVQPTAEESAPKPVKKKRRTKAEVAEEKRLKEEAKKGQPDPSIQFTPAHVSAVASPKESGQSELNSPMQIGATPSPASPASPAKQSFAASFAPQAPPPATTVMPPPSQAKIPLCVSDEDEEMPVLSSGDADFWGDEEEDTVPVMTASVVAPHTIPLVSSSPTAQMAIDTSRDFIADFNVKNDEPEDDIAQFRINEAAIHGIVERMSADYAITAAYSQDHYNSNDIIQKAVHTIRFESYLLNTMEVSVLNEWKASLSSHVISVLAMYGRMRSDSDRYGKWYGELMDARVGKRSGGDTIKDKKAAILREDPEIRRVRHQYYLAVTLEYLFENMAKAFENLTHSLNRIIDDRIYDKQREMGGQRTR